MHRRPILALRSAALVVAALWFLAAMLLLAGGSYLLAVLGLLVTLGLVRASSRQTRA